MKRKTWGFFKILKRNVVINIPSDMWFERKATILALIQKYAKLYVKFLILNLEVSV